MSARSIRRRNRKQEPRHPLVLREGENEVTFWITDAQRADMRAILDANALGMLSDDECRDILWDIGHGTPSREAVARALPPEDGGGLHALTGN